MDQDLNLKRTASTPRSGGMARRSVVGGLVAGVLAAAGLEAAGAKKGGNGKGRGKGRGKGKGKGRGKGQGQPKVQICHRHGNGFTLISVSQSAIQAHESHGDVVCAVSDCQTGEATGCADDGACVFTLAAVDTECLVNGADGKCTAEGICKPLV